MPTVKKTIFVSVLSLFILALFWFGKSSVRAMPPPPAPARFLSRTATLSPNPSPNPSPSPSPRPSPSPSPSPVPQPDCQISFEEDGLPLKIKGSLVGDKICFKPRRKNGARYSATIYSDSKILYSSLPGFENLYSIFFGP